VGRHNCLFSIHCSFQTKIIEVTVFSEVTNRLYGSHPIVFTILQTGFVLSDTTQVSSINQIAFTCMLYVSPCTWAIFRRVNTRIYTGRYN